MNLTQAVKAHHYFRGMETKKKIEPKEKTREAPRDVRNPELIGKFYKQIINGFGYAYPGKV
jgi:hypothetical protein